MARYWSTPINNVPKILEAETQEETNSLIIHLTGWHVHCIHNVGLISIQIKGINKTVEIKLMATRFPTNLKIVKSTLVKNRQKLSHAKKYFFNLNFDTKKWPKYCCWYLVRKFKWMRLFGWFSTTVELLHDYQMYFGTVHNFMVEEKKEE